MYLKFYLLEFKVNLEFLLKRIIYNIIFYQYYNIVLLINS